MGRISQLSKASEPRRSSRLGEDGRRLWREVFGTDKEEGLRPRVRPPASGPGRSLVSSDVATQRLVQALRSMAPGGWSDDRWEQMRHFVGINYVAVHRKCTQLQRAEFQVFVKDPEAPDGKRPVTEQDPPQGGRFAKPYDLVKLLEKPNPQDTFGDVMYRWGQQKDLTGMALTWMLPNRLGVPMELYVIPTAIAIPQPAVNPDFPDGYYRIQPVYPYGPFSTYPTPTTAVGAPIPAQWMLRFLYPHPLLRYDGYSPLTAMRLEMDTLDSINRGRWYTMKRLKNPSAVLNFDDFEAAEPLPEPEIDRIKAEFENEFEGPENAGKLYVAQPGSRLEPWGQRPVDMDFPAGWDQLTSFILGGAFGITKTAAGMVEDNAYATLYATLKQLYWLTLEPDAENYAAKLTRHLAPFFGDNLIVEIRMKPINDHEIVFQKVDKIVSLKGMPESVIKLAMQMMEVPVEPEVVKDLSEAKEEAGMAPPGAPVPGGGTEGMEPGALEEAAETEEIEAERPEPGNLSRGSLGPRMKRLRAPMLPRLGRKSLYQMAREVMANGH